MGMRHLSLGLVLCLALVGCSHNAKHGAGKGAGHGSAASQGAGDGAHFAGAEGDLLAKRKIYFEFDRSEIREQDYPVIQAHADFLKDNGNRQMRVEGHTDEQGSREYNIALGEKRAHAVKSALISQGANPNQLTTVSYGKEKPEVDGHGEEMYSVNRRAVLVYENS